MSNVFTGVSRKNRPIAIRYPKKSDLKSLWRYINELSQEKTFIRIQGKKISLKDEKKFLDAQLEHISKKTGILLLAFCDKELVGASGIDMADNVEQHVGEFGISIKKGFRGEGIGKILMKTVLKEAPKNIPQLKIIRLFLFSNNPTGYEMYKKLGFIEYGRLPKGIKHRGKYVDRIHMYKPF